MLHLLAALLLPQAPTPAPAPAVHFAKARLVASGWPDDAAIPMLADVDGDGFGDLLAMHLEGNGSLEFARNVRGGKFGTGAIPVRLPDGASLAGVVAVRVHREKDQPARITLHRQDGSAWVIRKDDQGYLLTDAGQAPDPAGTLVLTLWAKDATDLQGDFDGDGKPDVLRGDQMSCGRGPSHPIAVPFLRELPPGARVIAGDFQGDRKDDLLVLRRDGAWRLGRDVLLYLSYLESDSDWDGDGLDNKREAELKTDPLDADTDHDGLLDGWEVLGEGGIDLPALGASPLHKDCFVFVQRYDNTDGARARSEIGRAAQYWATLGVKNPDGAPGIHLVPMWLGPLSAQKGIRSWWEVGEENLPVAARGLAHYIVVSPGGGGQSSELGTMGGCGDHALYATFLHEFGHQVGLSHSGGTGAGGSPVYTSLMNYSYSYGFEDDYNKIHYSNGSLACLSLREHELSERLPLPIEKLAFLAKGPYRFKLQADGDGTWVDWNRNGVFDAGPVSANITDTYGVNGGQRFPLGKSLTGPALVEHTGTLFLFTVDKDHHLARRRNTGEGKWEEPQVVPQVAPTGEPWAISADGELHLFVPTQDGVAWLHSADAAGVDQATVTLLPDSAGCAVSATAFQGRLLALLWTSPAADVRVAERVDATFGAPRPLASLRSEMCPAAVEDPATHELCVAGALVEKEKDVERRRWYLARLPTDGGDFRVASCVHPGGDASGWAGNTRPVLLCEGKDMPAPGRLHLIGAGWLAPGGNGCFYEAITIGDAAVDGGWRLRRFYDEWTTTRWALGACCHGGDIALAFGWANTPGQDADGNVHVSHHALGLGDGVLSDFDDVTHISEVGLAHSIAWRHGTVR